jgi:hypothetical protein
MTTDTYLVSADHSHADYCFRATAVRVSRDRIDGTYFAQHPKLGCGKSRPTPEQAIRHLFHDHACTGVEIVGPL